MSSFSFMNPFTFKPKKVRPNISFQAQPDDPQLDEVVPPRKTIMDQYRELSGNHPYQDRLVAAMESAPREEDYAPGKLRRLGAILSGVGASFQDPGSGAFVTDKILRSPYEDARKMHREQIGDLTALVDMERSRINQDLNALNISDSSEDRKADFGERRATRLAGERQWQQEFGLKTDEAKRLGNLTEAQIEDIRDQIAQRGSAIHMNEMDGLMYRIDKNGGITQLGNTKFGATFADKNSASMRELNAKLSAEDRVNQRDNETRREVATTNANAKLKAGLGKLNNSGDPSKVRIAQEINGIAAMYPDVNMDDLIDFETGVVRPDSNGIFGDSEREKQAKAALRNAIANAQRGGGNPNTDPLGLGANPRVRK